jgi:hypothetical protein
MLALRPLGTSASAPAANADSAALLALGPRLAEGLAPWRNREEALAAPRRWLEDSMAAAATGDGALGELAVATHVSRRGPGERS